MQDCQIPTLSMLPNPIRIQIGDMGCDFECVKQKAISRAMSYGGSPELLSWYDRKRKAHFPDDECCVEGEPNWLAYALAKNADLAVDVNDEEYVFIFRKSGQ